MGCPCSFMNARTSSKHLARLASAASLVLPEPYANGFLMRQLQDPSSSCSNTVGYVCVIRCAPFGADSAYLLRPCLRGINPKWAANDSNPYRTAPSNALRERESSPSHSPVFRSCRLRASEMRDSIISPNHERHRLAPTEQTNAPILTQNIGDGVFCFSDNVNDQLGHPSTTSWMA
jgi:hypothetical protein